MRSRRAMVLVLGAVLAVAAACSRKPASIQITVETAGKGGKRSKDVKIYGIDRSQRLSAQVLDKNGKAFEQTTATWSASNANVEAEPGGRIVAKKPGKAMVTAEYQGVSAQIPVEVVDVATIEISPVSLALTGPAGTAIPVSWTVKDSRQKVVALKPEWSSANTKIATVADGVVTSVAPGTTTIVARIGDVQGGSDVTVILRPIARLEIRPATALAHVGENQHFEVKAYGPDGALIPEAAAVFSSSNPAVATVDSAGVAEGRATGAAKIRAELAGQVAEATLLVN
ncbi:MAG TPA: hypothetical protein VMT25_03350 [Thermoanaerobaculia bacterium]|nr:hypothetical protein [Thermoanaerobaculia bacterium]